MNDVYEIVDRQINIPKRSILYGLKTLYGTKDFTDSLNAYIVRLSMAHCVTPIDLIAEYIIPNIEKSKWNTTYPKKAKSIAISVSRTILSPSETSVKWTNRLEELTCIKNLSFLTMQPWKGIISPYMLIRKEKYWCPTCYSEMKEKFGFVYDPLIWSLKVIETCPIHNTFLAKICPSCKNSPSDKRSDN